MERVLAEKFKELDTMNTQVKVCKQSFEGLFFVLSSC